MSQVPKYIRGGIGFTYGLHMFRIQRMLGHSLVYLGLASLRSQRHTFVSIYKRRFMNMTLSKTVYLSRNKCSHKELKPIVTIN
jgi:hypothetical protein